MSEKSNGIKATAYLIVTGVLVTVLGQWAIQSIWPADEGESIEELLDRSPIDLQRWQAMTLGLNQAPDHVRENLFRDYLGEQVVWRGYFSHFRMAEPGATTPGNAVMVIMYDSLDSLDSTAVLGPPSVRCFFTADAQRQLESLTRGQEIVIRGTLATPLLTGSVLATDLSKCALLAAGDERHQLALVERKLR